MSRSIQIILGAQPFKFERPTAIEARQMAADAMRMLRRHEGVFSRRGESYIEQINQIARESLDFLKRHIPDLQNAGAEASDCIANATPTEIMGALRQVLAHIESKVLEF